MGERPIEIDRGDDRRRPRPEHRGDQGLTDYLMIVQHDVSACLLQIGEVPAGAKRISRIC
jgi:hypothetical protein